MTEETQASTETEEKNWDENGLTHRFYEPGSGQFNDIEAEGTPVGDDSGKKSTTTYFSERDEKAQKPAKNLNEPKRQDLDFLSIKCSPRVSKIVFLTVMISFVILIRWLV